ncbi:MAG: hypothetical protein A2234_06415 [Elusimicrobia bacterium RIFOXYA2_FULL_58_8]|nr:MAG: hypothetical protein A2285_03170 [Elusimicrobia bacterium RIFOXYA12_FULL_57_11]OGS17432.1 MAG: hypothetical protein A2234_06415 [Elusimicrobia bacterium RIFOXYA2_FULL_58_8]
MKSIVAVEIIERKMFVRGQKVILGAELARLYGVSTKVFNQAIKRNARRSPTDFMFRLTAPEAAKMRSQSVAAF